MILRELFVKLGVKTDKASADAFRDSLSGVKREAKSLVKVMAGLTAAAGAVAVGVWQLTRRTADAADEAAKKSQTLGITTEAYQELNHAADLTGISMGQVGQSMRNVARHADDAAHGVGRGAELFDRLKIDAENANGELRESDEILMDIADEIAGLESETEQMAMAADVLGRSGTEMLPFLRHGREGIEQMREEAHEFGAVISDETAADFEHFNDNLVRGRRFLEGFRNTLAITLLPRINDTIEGMLDWARANQDLIRSRIEQFAESLSGLMENMAEKAVEVDEAVQAWGGWEPLLANVARFIGALGVGKLLGKLGALGAASKKAFVALKVAAAAAGASLGWVAAIGAVVVGWLVATVLTFQDLIVWIQGGDSAFGRLLDRMGMADEARELLEGIIDLMRLLGSVIGSVSRVITSTFMAAWNFMWAGIEPILSAIGRLIQLAIQQRLERAIETTSNTVDQFQVMADFIADMADDIEGFMTRISEAVQEPGQVFEAVWTRAIDVVGSLIERIMGQIDRAMDAAGSIPGVGRALDIGGTVASTVGDAFAPSRPSGGTRQNNVSQSGSVSVNVDASGAPNAEEVGTQTAERTEQALWRVLRQADVATTGGEL